MNELVKVFENSSFGSVRIVMRNGEPLFVAKDVADGIGHSDTSAMCKLCRDKDKVVVNYAELKHSDDLSECFKGQQSPNLTLISESGLYRILAKCNLPKCEPFESWVFDEVLPSIRKTGSYSMAPKSYAEALRALAAEVEEKEKAQLALEAEKEQHAKDNQEWRNGFDIVNRQKSQISTQREKTAMITASIKSRENIKLRDENEKLLDENDKLREQIGDSKNMKAVRAITWLDKYFDLKIPENKHVDKSIADKLKKICLQHSKTLQNGEIEFEEGWAIGHIDDPAYKNGLNIYPIKAIDLLEKLLEERHPFTEPLNRYRYGYSKC